MQLQKSGVNVSDKLYCPALPSYINHLIDVFRICDRERDIGFGHLQAIKTRDILIILPDATSFELEVLRVIDDEYLKAYHD